MYLTPLSEKPKCENRYSARFAFPLLFFIVVACQSALFAQPIFSPGQIITAAGDTLRGQIGEFGGKKNYQECVFRLNDSKEIQRFTPVEIQAYYIEDRRYFSSRQVTDANGETMPVFAEWIVKGGTSVIKINDAFFIIRNADTLQRVPFRDLNNARTKEDLESSRRTWMAFLNTFAARCFDIVEYYKKEKNTISNEENLLRIVRMHNDCMGTSYTEYGGHLPALAAEMGLSVSADYATLQFESEFARSFPYLVQSDFNHLGARLGVAFLVRSPRRLSTFSLYLEPSIRYYQFESDVLTVTSAGFEDRYYHTTMQWLGIGSPFALRYTIPNRKPSLSFQFGPTLQWQLQPKTETTEEIVVERGAGRIVTTNYLSPVEFASYQFGYGGQINLRHQWQNLPGQWEIAAGFQRGGGIVLEDVLPVDGRLTSFTNNFFVKAVWLW